MDFADAFLAHAALFLLITLVLWFGGDRPILAGTVRCGIKNVARFNRWAGNRFLILPVLAFGLAQASEGSIQNGILGLMLFWFAFFGVVIWIDVGSKRFKE